jgi:hypothetical protein
VVADVWSQRTHLSQFKVEKMPSELCDKFNKLNLRIVTNIEVMEMEEDFTLGYAKRSTGRREVSYPVFMPKPSTHHMCAQKQLFHTY